MDAHRQQVDFLQTKQENKNIVTKIPQKDGSTNTTQQKDEKQVKCGLALFSFEDEDEWYIDSGCSHLMSRDKKKFESLNNNKDGKVIPGNCAPTKVVGKGRAKLNKYMKATNALLVQGLKTNIRSVRQIANKGNIIVFT